MRAGQVELAASTLFAGVAPTTSITSTTSASVLIYIPIGLDGLAIVVHSTNPVQNLTLLQLRALYSGRILDWAGVGGKAGDVLLVSREDGSGSRLLFEQRVMGDEAVSLTAVVMPTSADVVDYVAKNPQAIGYVSRGYVAQVLTENPLTTTATVSPTAIFTGQPVVRVVPVEGQLPTLSNLLQQRYFLTQPLYLLSRGEPQGWARQFLDFVLSPAGQAIVARYHAPVR